MCFISSRQCPLCVHVFEVSYVVHRRRRTLHDRIRVRGGLYARSLIRSAYSTYFIFTRNVHHPGAACVGEMRIRTYPTDVDVHVHVPVVNYSPPQFL